MQGINISDNFGRRSGMDRRQASLFYAMEDRRSGTDRRSGIDRRSGFDRRDGEEREPRKVSIDKDRRRGDERRKGYKQIDPMMH